MEIACEILIRVFETNEHARFAFLNLRLITKQVRAKKV